MRILHVTSSLDPAGGGVPVGLAELAMSQAAAGLDVELVSTWVTMPATATAERLTRGGIKVGLMKAHEPRSWHPRLPRWLRERIGENQLVHIHGMWEQIQFWAGRIARQTGRPYVISPHGMISPWSMGQRNWGKRLYLQLFLKNNLAAASAIHYTTTIEREDTGLIPLHGATVIEPTGVSLAEFQNLPAPGEFRAAFREIGDRQIILSLGRLSRQKGLDLLIPAFAEAQLENTVLVLAGPDEDGYKSFLESLISRHGIQDRVLFTGMVRGRQRIAALVDAQLFALPSYQENFGLVVVEAMAAGRAVLISNRVNIHPEVAAAGAGSVFPCDIAQIAGELRRWMSDPSLCRDAGKRGRSFAFEQYDSLPIAKRWVDHYAHLIQQKPAAAI